MTSNYSEIQNGWFGKSGGQFFYGIQGSKTIGKGMEINLRIGATNAQGNHENALLPVYFSVRFDSEILGHSEKTYFKWNSPTSKLP